MKYTQQQIKRGGLLQNAVKRSAVVVNNVVDNVVNSGVNKVFSNAFLCLFMLLGQFVFSAPGDFVNNTAVFSSNSGVFSASTDFTVRSEIDFLKLVYYPDTPGAENYSLPAGQCVDAGGSTITLNTPAVPGGNSFSTGDTISLVEADTFKSGEPVFVRVVDVSANTDSMAIDELEVSLDLLDSSEEELILLRETGLDTGEFIGYANSTSGESSPNDCLLNFSLNGELSASYVDAANQYDAVSESVLVDPFGRVFNALTGELLDGAEVRLVRADGSDATVFGDFSFEAYPNVVLTGEEVTTSGGVYPGVEGGYRFPFIQGGAGYRLEVTLEEYIMYGEELNAQELAELRTLGDFVLTTGSGGEEFYVPIGPAIQIDIPMIPQAGGLYINKKVNKEVAGIGEFVQYEIDISNLSNVRAALATTVYDVLPKGFRFQEGSARLDGELVPEPTIEADGKRLHFSIEDVAIQDTVTLSYVVAISAGAQLGEAINIAKADANAGLSQSNTSSATVIVRQDLFRHEAFLFGRVLTGNCDMKNATGIANARLYLEDGTFVFTDSKGRYHIEGLKPGAHVLQLDEITIEGYEIEPCYDNSRRAGNGLSRFIDLQGGTLWREDYILKKLPDPVEPVVQMLRSGTDGERVTFFFDLKFDDALMENNRAYIALPEDLEYISGSVRVNQMVVDEPEQQDNVLTFKLDDTKEYQELSLQIDTLPRDFSAGGDLVTRAWMTFELLNKDEVRTVNSINMLNLQRHSDIKELVIRPRFPSFSLSITDDDLTLLDDAVYIFEQIPNIRMHIVGHTDNQGIRKVPGRAISNNMQLGMARAQAVADYFIEHLNLNSAMVTVDSKGAREPIDTNKTPQGMSRNRRVEIFAFSDVQSSDEEIKMLLTNSGQQQTPLAELINRSLVIDKTLVKENNQTQESPGFQGLKEGDILVSQTHSIKVVLEDSLQPVLFVDGKEVNKNRIGAHGPLGADGKLTVYNYIGINFVEPGEHKIEVRGIGPFGNVRFKQEINIIRNGELASIEVVETEGNNADGKTPVRAKLLLRDNQGEIISTTMNLTILTGDLLPYQYEDLDDPLSGPLKTVEVQPDGTVEFAPVSRSGKYRLKLGWQNLVSEEIEIYVQPEYRDWILVGFGEGTVGHNSLSGNMENLDILDAEEDIYTEGRLAFFAKGRVKGKWLLTAAYDTGKDVDNSIKQIIDPDSYYTLYGDASTQSYEAASAKKLYLKIEKENYYALFGDFNTGLTVTELSKYNRSVTGFKTEYDSEKLSLNVFAVDTKNSFLRDEMRGDGTSGLYRLRTNKIITNSEDISIETRDRFQSHKIVEHKTLTRHTDYNIDYETGTIWFKHPVLTQDDFLNPVWIVVEYETENADSHLQGGGRVAVKLMDKKVEIGTTLIHEGTDGNKGNLRGVDARVQVGEKNSIRAELARTDIDNLLLDETDGAYLIEHQYKGESVIAQTYLREQGKDFGLGQQSGTQSATRKAGTRAQVAIKENLSASAEVYRQTNLANKNERDVMDARVESGSDAHKVFGGLRRSKDSFQNQADNTSNQLIAGTQHKMMDNKLTLRATGEKSFSEAESGDFPDRLLLGADYIVSPMATVFVTQEFSWGELFDAQETRAGVNAYPWKGATVTTSVARELEEFGPRVYANAGLNQEWWINPTWTMDFGLDRVQTIRNPGIPQVNNNVPAASGVVSNDYTTAHIGAAMKGKLWRITNRFEFRTADSEIKRNYLSGMNRKLSEAVAIGMRLTISDLDVYRGVDEVEADLAFSYAYRPLVGRWVVLDKLEFLFDEQTATTSKIIGRRWVNNLNSNFAINDTSQLAIQYGSKYVLDTIDSEQYKGYTDLTGLEYRHDITEHWDWGTRASVLHSWSLDTYDQSYGLSLGFSPIRDIWLNLGYNFEGFRDGDFSGSEYTQKGVYFTFRFKFDQSTVKRMTHEPDVNDNNYIKAWGSQYDSKPSEF